MKLFKFLFPLIILTSCAIEQEYFFQENGEVKMDVGINMSQLMKSMPPGDGDDKMDFSKLKDSLKSSDIMDSLKEYGITDFDISFDSTTYVMATSMTFKDLKSFNDYMNKNLPDSIEPVKLIFDKKSFSIKNGASLISNDILGEMNKGGAETEGMDMSSFMTFKTTYHFPYEIKNVNYKGESKIGEDGKSLIFDNVLDDFTNQEYFQGFKITFK